MSTEKFNKNIDNNSDICNSTKSKLQNLKIEINKTLRNNVNDIIEESCKNKWWLRLNTTKQWILDYIMKWNLWSNKNIFAEAQILELSKHHLNRKLRYIIKHPKDTIQNSLKKIKEKENIIKSFNANSKYDKIIKQYSNKNHVDPLLVKSIIWKESKFNPNACSGAWAKWLMQLTPITIKEIERTSKIKIKNTYDPIQNLIWGVTYIGYLIKKYTWNIPLALAAYNAGPWNIKKYWNKIPPFKETKDYVKKIMYIYNTIKN